MGNDICVRHSTNFKMGEIFLKLKYKLLVLAMRKKELYCCHKCDNSLKCGTFLVYANCFSKSFALRSVSGIKMISENIIVNEKEICYKFRIISMFQDQVFISYHTYQTLM